ncbi:glucosyltransferase domain-containing protein [Pseudobutyrivibrio xylanivorans]|uniref:Glucosyl transferase GtrII n=1 Tax=Pseudobutyrivibrio xylanivorans DSM 14809 TaxID=1123012 RepID=A0A1M6KN48_PSEXY|nr:glucosyltransferase domain-containing protein [Pseudobutyrivibrio xylanivorans]SHJ60357.1 Glucosyl transferase GtrII [Pseudobutyrivibrio xylanivorans DSM 14809]
MDNRFIFSNIWENRQRVKRIGIYSFILYVITYGYVMGNYAPCHDGMRITQVNLPGLEGLGRVLIPYYINIRGMINSPWLIGFISGLFLFCSIILIADMLDIWGDFKSQLIIAVVFMLNQCFISTITTFIYILDINMLALLLSVLAVYILNYNYKVTTAFISGILLALSLALYQAYLGVAIGLYVVLFIKKIISNEELNIKLFIFTGGSLVASGIFYILILKYFVETKGIMLLEGGYNSLDNIQKLSFMSIISTVLGTYKRFYGYLLESNLYNSNIFRLCIVFLIIVGVIGYVYRIYCVGSVLKAIALIALFIIFPVATGIVFIISGGTLHNLMTYPFQLFYILIYLPFVVQTSENKYRKYIKYIILFVYIVMAFIVIRFANDLFYYEKISADSTFSTITAFDNDIKKAGFEPSKHRMIIVGDISNSFKRYYQVDATQFSYVGNYARYGTTITYNSTLSWYFMYVLGETYYIDYYPYKEKIVIDGHDYTDVIDEMNTYPKEGYCKLVDEYMIVKMKGDE